MLFSKRKKLTHVRNVVQSDEVDDELRIGLWNAFYECILQKNKFSHYSNNLESSNLYTLFRQYWHNLFKAPLDNIPNNLDSIYKRIREYFFQCKWYELYDFIEFTAQKCPEVLQENYVCFCNHILEKELSAYRLVGNQVTDITNAEEIESIESAINATTKYSGANKHLQTAIAFLSDRKSPDYRNSIKESISAIESICVSISDSNKATLGDALRSIEKRHKLHPAFKNV